MTHLFSIQTAVSAAILLLTVSCSVPPLQEDAARDFTEPDSLSVRVEFQAFGGNRTKMTGVTDAGESAIGRWALFVFDSQSDFFRRETSEGGSSLTMQLIAGRDYTCYAMVNYPLTGTGAFDPSTVRSPRDLTEKVAYLADNGTSALLMFGKANVKPLKGETMTVTIKVKRLVSKIDLRGLEVNFNDPHLALKPFILRSVYITNAYRTTRYESDYSWSELSETRAAWYNTGGWHRGESAEDGMDRLLGDTGINAVVSGENPYTVTHSFYPFPNPTPLPEDIRTIEAWTRRCTRLVIEASIDSDIVYYAINVPGMARNCLYAASNVVIHGRGSRDPESAYTDPDIITGSVEPVIDDGWNGMGDITLD